MADEHELQAALAAFAQDDNRANTLRLAGEYARLGRFDQAIPHYRAATRDGIDVHAGFRLANAQYWTGDFAGALATLEAMPPVPIQADPEFVELLLARVLVGLGRKADAAAVYAEVIRRPPSWYACYEYGELALELGRPDAAIAALERVERAVQRGSHTPSGDEVERYRWATERLAELRAG